MASHSASKSSGIILAYYQQIFSTVCSFCETIAAQTRFLFHYNKTHSIVLLTDWLMYSSTFVLVINVFSNSINHDFYCSQHAMILSKTFYTRCLSWIRKTVDHMTIAIYGRVKSLYRQSAITRQYAKSNSCLTFYLFNLKLILYSFFASNYDILCDEYQTVTIAWVFFIHSLCMCLIKLK